MFKDTLDQLLLIHFRCKKTLKDSIFLDLKLVVVFVGLLAHYFATIANFQWFSKLQSPLNGMVKGNHWDQWLSDGFQVRKPLVTMVFDGCAPSVRRWNGYVPSLKSNRQCLNSLGTRSEDDFEKVSSTNGNVSHSPQYQHW